LNIVEAHSKAHLKAFVNVSDSIYKDNPYYRNTDNDVLEILLSKNNAFRKHASILPCLIFENEHIAARFFLIHDTKLPEFVQVAFFEAMPNISDLAKAIETKAKECFPEALKIIIGLNGHLNYGAGILLNQFDKVPLFGLNYNPEYYQHYFTGYQLQKLYSYRFEALKNYSYAEILSQRLKSRNIKIRQFNKNNFAQEIEIYTRLNNECFGNHQFWTHRTAEEDMEIFYPFRFLLRGENFLIAEHKGVPIGFILWFPDFNEMVHTKRQMKASWRFDIDVLKYRLLNPVKTFRLAEIGVIPKYQKKGIEFLLLSEMMTYVKKRKYVTGEGGFILESNASSNVMAQRYIERISGKEVLPFRSYALFINDL